MARSEFTLWLCGVSVAPAFNDVAPDQVLRVAGYGVPASSREMKVVGYSNPGPDLGQNETIATYGQGENRRPAQARGRAQMEWTMSCGYEEREYDVTRSF